MIERKANCLNIKNGKMDRFLEVCLLVLLYDKLGYGYGLIEDLEPFGFSSEELNVSTLYRTLRKMENEDLVTSLWEESGLGPKRRIYKITEAGKTELDNWITILKRRKNRIKNLIDKYEDKTTSLD
jgi:poly-beta-hydroxybutyrate-responsive repressor